MYLFKEKRWVKLKGSPSLEEANVVFGSVLEKGPRQQMGSFCHQVLAFLLLSHQRCYKEQVTPPKSVASFYRVGGASNTSLGRLGKTDLPGLPSQGRAGLFPCLSQVFTSSPDKDSGSASDSISKCHLGGCCFIHS